MLLRAFFAVAVPWIFLLVVALFGPAFWGHTLGAAAGTVGALLMANRMVGKLNPLGLLTFGPWFLVPCALVLGTGAAIITSEVINIALSFREVAPNLKGGRVLSGTELVWFAAATVAIWGGLTMVVLGATQRVLLMFLPQKFTVILAALAMLLAVMWDPLEGLRYALILVPSAWLYARSGSLLTAMAAWVPAAAGLTAITFGYGPGIDGFDVTATDRVLWQPLWFNLVGAACVIGGLLPILEFSTPSTVGIRAKRT